MDAVLLPLPPLEPELSNSAPIARANVAYSEFAGKTPMLWWMSIQTGHCPFASSSAMNRAGSGYLRRFHSGDIGLIVCADRRQAQARKGRARFLGAHSEVSQS